MKDRVISVVVAAVALTAVAEPVVVRTDYVQPASAEIVPIRGETLYCMVSGMQELYRDRPDLALFDHPFVGVGGWLRQNDLARFKSMEPPPNAWTNFPVRFSEVFASKEWKGARERLAEYERLWPNVIFNVYFYGSSPPGILKRTFDTDPVDFAAWRAKHPGFFTFEALDEYDSQIHGLTCARLGGFKDERLTRRYAEQYGEDPQAYGLQRRSIDLDYAKEKSFHFQCDDLGGLWTVVPSLGHHMARKGFRYLYYEAEHTSVCSPWRWGGAYGRGATRQYHTPFGWYSAMTASWSVTRDGKNPIGLGGVKSHVDFFTYWPNPEQPHRVPHLGASRSLLRRNVRYGFFIGGELAQIECARNSIHATAADGKSWTLSPYGEDFNDMFEWHRHYDRGSVYAPVAFLTSIDENLQRQCHNMFPTKDEGTIPAFLFTLIPSYTSQRAWFHDAKRGKEGCLWNSEFGEIADFVCPDGGQPTDVFAKFLSGYKAAFLIGYHNPKATDTAALAAYVRGGGTLFCSCDQVRDGIVPSSLAGVTFGDKTALAGGKLVDETGRAVETFAEAYSLYVATPTSAKPFLKDEKGSVVAWVADAGKGRVVTVAVRRMMPDAFRGLREDGYRTQQFFEDPAYYETVASGKRKFPIVHYLLKRVQEETMPIRVAGDIQWGLNRVKTSGGCGRRMATSSTSNNQTIKQSNNSHWMLWLINNRGVTKFALEPEELDMSETSAVTVDLKDLKGAKVRDITDSNPNNAVCLPVKDGKFTVLVKPGEDRRIEITR